MISITFYYFIILHYHIDKESIRQLKLKNKPLWYLAIIYYNVSLLITSTSPIEVHSKPHRSTWIWFNSNLLLLYLDKRRVWLYLYSFYIRGRVGIVQHFFNKPITRHFDILVVFYVLHLNFTNHNNSLRRSNHGKVQNSCQSIHISKIIF